MQEISGSALLLDSFRVREKYLLQGLRPVCSAGGVPIRLNSLQPLDVRQVEKPQLQPASLVGSLELQRPLNLSQLASTHLELDVVAGQRFPLVLNSESLFIEPQRRFLFGQPFFTVHSPVHEPGIPQRIEDPGETCREKCSL